MKFFFTLFTLIFIPTIFAQNEKLWIETDDVILQGNIEFSSYPQLFVGQEYYFTVIANKKDFDLEIMSENLEVTLMPESKKQTGGLELRVIPIDTGKCFIQLSVGKDQKRASSLISRSFPVSHYPMPPIFISKIRTGEIISELKQDAELTCMYDRSLGIFKPFVIKSWTAKLGEKEFSGNGTYLSKELINAIDLAKDGFLVLKAELEPNNTGYSFSEAVFILR